MESLAFKNSEQALSYFEAHAPQGCNQEGKYMEISSQEDFDFAKKFQGEFGIFMRKDGEQKYLTEKYMGGLSAYTFEALVKAFTKWYQNHFLENRDSVAYYDVEFCEAWLADALKDGDEKQIADKRRILQTVKTEGAGFYTEGAYEQLLQDGQTLTSFGYDNESYCIGFELDVDHYDMYADE